MSESTWIQSIGWTLLHFVWQGALVALVVALLLKALASATARHAVCLAGLLAMMVFPVATFLRLEAASPSFEPALVLGPSARPGWSDSYERLAPLVAATWLLGALVLQSRSALLWIRALRLRRSGVPAPVRWREEAQSLGERLGLRRAVRVLESRRVSVPAMIGWLRPVILVPTFALTRLTPEQLRIVLAHELAHVRRHDYVINLIQSVFESTFFYHPAVWWLSRRLREEREYCCDDLAIQVCGNALDYARALASLDEARAGTVEPALASTGGSLMKRIQRLVDRKTGSARTLWSGAAPTVLILAVLAVGIGAAVAHAHRPEGLAQDQEKGHSEEGGLMEKLHRKLIELHGRGGSQEELHEHLKVLLHGESSESDDLERHLAELERLGLTQAELHERMARFEKVVRALHVDKIAKALEQQQIRVEKLRRDGSGPELQKAVNELEALKERMKAVHLDRALLELDEQKVHQTVEQMRAAGLGMSGHGNRWGRHRALRG